jgi:hypothetical protein
VGATRRLGCRPRSCPETNPGHFFEKWEIPEALTFHQFLVRVGEFGGYAVLETDDLAEVEKAIAIYAAFQFRLEPVLDVEEAVRAQAEGIAWRDSNAPSS